MFSFGGSDTDSSGPAGRIFAGYQFNNYFALELGFTQFSDTTVDYYIPFTTYPIGTGKLQENAIDLMAKGILPLSQKFNAFGKLGAAYVTAKTSYDFNYGTVNSETYHEVLPAAAIGLSYDITPNVPVELSYMHIQQTGSDIESADFISLGISYHFDM